MRKRRHVLPAVAGTILVSTLLLGFWLSPSIDHSKPTGGGQAESANVVNDEDDFKEIFLRAAHMLAVGRHQEAIAELERARLLRPRQPEVYVNLGFAKLVEGEFRAAEQHFRTALDLQPSQVNAYFGWAESLEAMGDIEAALGAMRTFIHLAAEDDPFLRRAHSAVWEWSDILARQPISHSEDKHDPDSVPTLRQIEQSDPAFLKNANKVRIINIWATWCPPCRTELPSLQSLSKKLDPEKFEVIGISVDEDADYVREFLKDTGVSYPNYLDSEKKIAGGQFGVDSYPQTLILRPDGVLVDRVIGARDWVSDGFVHQLQQLARGPGK